MLKIGITGGIGSGKSTICNILKNLGVPVFSSDDVGKQLMNEDEELIRAIIKAFGKDMYNAAGELDRHRMAATVFNDPREMEKLIALVHPKVKVKFEEWCLNHERKAYVIKEAAILFESGLYHDLDKIVNVFAPRELRIQRVVKRDGATVDSIEKRMRFQYNDEERNNLADFIIMNDGQTDLLPEVMELHEILLNENKNAKALFK